MNRLWNLWCGLSGANPDDSHQKVVFNTDRRVAMLSSLDPELVEGFATKDLQGKPGAVLEDFLDRWLAAVSRDESHRYEALEPAADADRLPSEQDARQRALEQADRLPVAEEDVQRQPDEVTERHRRTEVRDRQDFETLAASTAREQIEHLYNITPVTNLARIASRGILCHDLANDIPHEDVSEPDVQRWRGKVHQYASLYLNPRNAMLYRLHVKERRAVVVLVVSAGVLELPDVLVSDGNAAAGGTRLWNRAEGLAKLNLQRVHSRRWVDDAGVVDTDLKRVMQAEVLVPQRVPPHLIEGYLAPSREILDRAMHAVGHWDGQIDRSTFFEAPLF